MNVKEIEQRCAKGYDFTSEDSMRQMGNDIEWLIDQSKKVERLEYEVERLKYWEQDGKTENSYYINKSKSLEQENVRLRNQSIRYDNAFDYIDKSLQAEISSRNEMNMDDLTKGKVSAFVIANKIFRKAKESV